MADLTPETLFCPACGSKRCSESFRLQGDSVVRVYHYKCGAVYENGVRRDKSYKCKVMEFSRAEEHWGQEREQLETSIRYLNAEIEKSVHERAALLIACRLLDEDQRIHKRSSLSPDDWERLTSDERRLQWRKDLIAEAKRRA